MPDDLDAIVAGATNAALRSYIEAIASEIRGGVPSAWDRFERITARALVLSDLNARADMVERLDIAPDDAPVTIIDRFARDPAPEFDPFTIAPFVAALEALQKRIPAFADASIASMRRATALASGIRNAEQGVAAQRVLGFMRTKFIVRGVDVSGTTEIRTLLADILEAKQTTLPDFIDASQARGAENLARFRLETVYRNNLSRSFSEGQMRTVSDTPEARRAFPLFRISSIRDRRTRGNPAGLYPDRGVHWQMHGYVNTPEAFRSMGIVTPNGHNCRCTMVPIPLVRAISLGFMTAEGVILPEAIRRHNGSRQQLIDSGQYPDPGWIALAA